MKEAFIEWLDQMYWKGYTEQFEDDNPISFQKQLNEFKHIHNIYIKVVRLSPKNIGKVGKSKNIN